MDQFETLALSRSEEGVATLAFLVPGRSQNIFTRQVLEELGRALDVLDRGPAPTGLLIASGRAGSFFAGADLERLEEVVSGRVATAEIERICSAGRAVFDRLSSSAWPSVAVIDGVCLGGGLELALACDLRVATDAAATSLGCPEVKLGLLPGWGGTVRLARLVGPAAAIELAAAGEPLGGRAAEKLGLVDACVPPAAANESARRLLGLAVRDSSHRVRRQRMAGAVPLDGNERAFLEATASAAILARSGGRYPAPQAIVRTILDGCSLDAEGAGRLESRAFAQLAATPVARNLVHLFRAGERNRKTSGDATTEPRRVAIIGAGVMGAGIAAASLRAGLEVAVADTSPETLEKGTATILDEASWDRSQKRSLPEKAVELATKLRSGKRLAVAADAELVIEAVTEKIEVKRAVFEELERLVSPDAVIATNTSTYRISRIAEAVADRSRVCGIHFFVPVRKRPLVEVVRGPDTSERTIERAVAFARRIGKLPIVVRDSPGFLVNRVLMPYLHESIEMVREGVPIERIDRAARTFGMPVGPIELYDLIGLDTAFYAGIVMHESFGDRIEASPVIPVMVRAGLLGHKCGAGFYLHGTSAKDQRPNPDVPKRLEPYALPPHGAAGQGNAYPEKLIVDRLFLPVVLEATLALDEGVVDDPAAVDLAVVHGLGFPADRGGILAWADALGAAEIITRLEPLESLGARMRPTARLRAMAREGRTFHAW